MTTPLNQPPRSFSLLRFLGLARDWQVVASERRDTTESRIRYGIRWDERKVIDTLVVERCSITGKERARLIRPPESLFGTIGYDLNLAKVELGLIKPSSTQSTP